jgi:hypothetical protein
MSSIIAWRFSTSLLNKVDFPTLGLPTIATMFAIYFLNKTLLDCCALCASNLAAGHRLQAASFSLGPIALSFAYCPDVIGLLTAYWLLLQVSKLPKPNSLFAPVAGYFYMCFQEDFFSEKYFHVFAGFCSYFL